ncbi:MAG TPA: hypothetical protein VLX58_22005 [Bryobacteraceae bacterium]|nr:hypothetical protein [Bryobacteraceae bacterium]
MSSIWVAAAYACAVGLSIALLHFFRARAWYWHVISIGLALALGLTPMPSQWIGPGEDLAIGSVFVFLVVWGAAAPLFRQHRAVHP